MRKKIVAANWKMNMTQAEAGSFVETLLREVEDVSDVEIVIVPPFTAIAKPIEAITTQIKKRSTFASACGRDERRRASTR